MLRCGRFPYPPLLKKEQQPRSYNRPLVDLTGVTEAERPPLIKAAVPDPARPLPDLPRIHGCDSEVAGLAAWNATRAMSRGLCVW